MCQSADVHAFSCCANDEEQLPSAVFLQVVAELRGDKTVEYIRSLEVAVGRYRMEVQQVRGL